MNNDFLTSRFFQTSDPENRKFVYQMPVEWWSRKYEYEWAKQMCRENHVVLDAACGIEHPLKYYLADHCAKCYACDIDPRLMDAKAVEFATVEGFVDGKQTPFPKRYIEDIQYDLAALTDLPYEDNQFDRVFCISVLEHLKDRANKWSLVRNAGPFSRLFRRDIHDSLVEFRRVLKPGGLIVLTFDFPRINLDYLRKVVAQTGLKFAGNVSFDRPQTSLYDAERKLYCFRAVLTTVGKTISGANVVGGRRAA